MDIYSETKKKLKDKLPMNFENIAMKEFSKFDKDKNGYIAGNEIIALLKNMAVHYGFNPEDLESNEQLQRSLLSEIDQNTDKMISYDEFKVYFLINYSKNKFLN